jgi:anti-anti-sigma regulatory factor
MAIFGKPTTRKTQGAKTVEADAKRESKVMSARELAAHAANRKSKLPGVEPLGETSMRGASVINWSTAPKAIEVAQANPGLCAVLENAALLFANSQDEQARALLEQGIVSDPDTKLSPLAWLALFDLIQRAGDRAAFDQLAMQYVLQFERSAPSWDDAVKARTGETGAGAGGGYIAVTGKLSSRSASQLEGLKRALEKCVPRARIDLASVTGFDDVGARLLAADLARARNQRMELAVERPDKLRAALEDAVAKGRDGGEGAWLLSLELMQWAHEQAAFDERALQFAVAFELSPPSWEPPPGARRAESSSPARVEPAARAAAAADSDAVVLDGVLNGPSPAALAKLSDFAARNPLVPIDMSGVERIDFICAGALSNAITRIESQGKAVQIAGATPIVRALLLLIGISPRHFVKKSD